MARRIIRYMSFFLVLLLGIGLLGACKKQEAEEEGISDGRYKLYYINNVETKLVSEDYKPAAADTQGLVDEMLEAMKKDPRDISYKKILSKDIQIRKTNLTDGQLTLYFSEGYSTLSGVSEILCRAAVVKTFCQIEGIDCVAFYVSDQPLMASSGDKAVGFMAAEDFIDNTGGETNFYQNTTVNLYFTNKKGNALKEIQVNIIFDGTIPMEQLVVERLILGPESIDNVDTDAIFPTIPKNTKLIKISSKDGICYVDVNEAFLEKLPEITDEVAIYSVVNSLAELTNVDKVQFTINGKSRATYRENTDFDIQFERNLDIVK